MAQLLDWHEQDVLGKAAPCIPVELVHLFRARRAQVFAGAAVVWHAAKLQPRVGAALTLTLYGTPAGADPEQASVAVWLGVHGESDLQTRLADQTYFTEQLLEAVVLPIFVKNEQGRYIAFNAAWERFFGRDRKRWLGKTNAEMVPPDEGAQQAQRDAKAYADGGTLRWADTLRDAAGHPAPVVYQKSVFRKANGAVSGIIGVVNERSENRQAEERFRRVVEMAPSALVMVDEFGRIVLVNAQTERLFGYTREELTGQSIDVLVPKRFRAAHPAYRQEFSMQPQSRPMGAGRDLYALRKTGDEFPVEIGLNPLETEVGSMVIATIVDISERQAAQERITAALAEKTILLNEVHHRVKNNLQVISSVLNLQAMQSQEPRVQAALSESQNRVQAMALVHQLLYERKDFSRVSLAEYLERLIAGISRTYQTTDKSVFLQLDLAQVFVTIEQGISCGLLVNELLSNAFKHAFPNRRDGLIQVSLQPSGTSQALLVIADDGVGLPEHIDFRNTGTLGLQLAPMLAEQLAATLKVNRETGTRFELRFDVLGNNQQ